MIAFLLESFKKCVKFDLINQKEGITTFERVIFILHHPENKPKKELFFSQIIFINYIFF